MGEIGREDHRGGGHKIREVWPAISWTVSSIRAQVDQRGHVASPREGRT